MSLLTVCQAAAEECGLATPSSIVGATDSNAKRLYRLALRAEREVFDAHAWSALVKEGTITASGGNTQYFLPTAYDRGVPDTVWNNSDSWPISGTTPISLWQARQHGWSISSRLNSAFRIAQVNQSKLIEFDPAPTNGHVISYRYVSNQRFWNGGGLQSTWVNDGHTSILDENLISLGLVWRILRAIGRDYRETQAEFRSDLVAAASHDAPAETILLGRANVLQLPAVTPETGYG